MGRHALGIETLGVAQQRLGLRELLHPHMRQAQGQADRRLRLRVAVGRLDLIEQRAELVLAQQRLGQNRRDRVLVAAVLARGSRLGLGGGKVAELEIDLGELDMDGGIVGLFPHRIAELDLRPAQIAALDAGLRLVEIGLGVIALGAGRQREGGQRARRRGTPPR